MFTDAPKTTYVIGHVDSLLAELQALLDWIAQDTLDRRRLVSYFWARSLAAYTPAPSYGRFSERSNGFRALF
jgi:hypothetical protein